MRRWNSRLSRTYVRRLRRGPLWSRQATTRWWADAKLARWRRGIYEPFLWSERQRVLLVIARYLLLNSSAAAADRTTRSWARGYYFEFGCYGARTMRMAYDTFHHAFDWTYVGFDSFEGLPDVPHDEAQGGIWRQGDLAIAEEDFIRLCVRHGIPRERLLTVKGFYDESLTPQLRDRLQPQKARVVYVDCDLYRSTVPVLEFVTPFLEVGTVLIFDDWFLYHGDPAQGERRAFAEFQVRHPRLRFEPLVSTGELQAFVLVDGTPIQPVQPSSRS